MITFASDCEYVMPEINTQYGWECPRCGRINAPWLPYCDCDPADYEQTEETESDEEEETSDEIIYPVFDSDFDQWLSDHKGYAKEDYEF